MQLPPHTAMLSALLLSFSLAAHAATDNNEEDDDLKAVYGDKLTVSIATGSQKSLRLAPAVTSVITAADIRAMGATDLDQVMETVAGVHAENDSMPFTSLQCTIPKAHTCLAPNETLEEMYGAWF